MIIGFFGLSHLGLVSAVAYASRGHTVIGYDANPNVILELSGEAWSIQEPGLLQTYLDNRNRISFTSDLGDLSIVDVIYFSQDVQTDPSGVSDLSDTENAINIAIETFSDNVVLVVLSQVPPGFTRKYSKIRKNFFYQVETLVFGNALARSVSPERIILGSQDVNCRSELLNQMLETFKCPIIWMDFESAELTKIAINMYLANSVTLTNALSEHSKIIGADWKSVKHALQLDVRIGASAYLNPGLGLSGGNIERDIETLRRSSTPGSLINRLTNLYQDASMIRRTWFQKQIDNVLGETRLRVTLLGLTYKPETNSTKNSIPFEIFMANRNRIHRVFDPAFLGNSQVFSEQNLWEAIHDAEVLLIGTPWQEFFGIEELVAKSQIKIVIDPYDVLDASKLTDIDKYVSLTREFQKQ